MVLESCVRFCMRVIGQIDNVSRLWASFRHCIVAIVFLTHFPSMHQEISLPLSFNQCSHTLQLVGIDTVKQCQNLLFKREKEKEIFVCEEYTEWFQCAYVLVNFNPQLWNSTRLGHHKTTGIRINLYRTQRSWCGLSVCENSFIPISLSHSF